MEVFRHFLDDYLRLIKEYVALVLSELIFNIDECGFSDWETRKEMPVIIPAETQGTALHYPINRQIRHQTLICCITTAGDGYCPCLSQATLWQLGFSNMAHGTESISESRLHHPHT
jgi:hypothetical protein